MFKIIIRGGGLSLLWIRECLNSLCLQTYKDFDVNVISDPSDYSLSENMPEFPFKIKYTVNENKMGLCYNMYRGVELSGAQDEDIICIVDSDDWLAPKALEIVFKKYEKKQNCLLTYGSYIKNSVQRKTKISRPYNLKDAPRKAKWHASHLKTFKYKLFKHFPPEYLQHKDKWGEAASDLGLMFGLMELAGMDRCYHIKDPIYYWRDHYAGSTKKNKQKEWEKIFRHKEPLKRIEF